MKIKFSRKVEFIPEWRKNRELPVEEQVKVTLKPLKIKDLLLTLDAFGGQASPGSVVTNDRLKSIMENVGHLVAKYAVVEGLEDDDGPVGTDAISEFPAYLDLAGEILMQLVTISLPSDEAAKNSNAQPV